MPIASSPTTTSMAAGIPSESPWGRWRRPKMRLGPEGRKPWRGTCQPTTQHLWDRGKHHGEKPRDCLKTMGNWRSSTDFWCYFILCTHLHCIFGGCAMSRQRDSSGTAAPARGGFHSWRSRNWMRDGRSMMEVCVKRGYPRNFDGSWMFTICHNSWCSDILNSTYICIKNHLVGYTGPVYPILRPTQREIGICFLQSHPLRRSLRI